MNDLEGITVSEQRRAIGFTGDDLPIAFDDNASRPNFEVFEECGDGEPVSDFFFLAVNF